MALTTYDMFSLEWAKACFKLNPTNENKRRLSEVKKAIKNKSGKQNYIKERG